MADEQPRARRTRQQEAVADFLRGRDTFASAQEIWAGLREGGSTIGLATVSSVKARNCGSSGA